MLIVSTMAGILQAWWATATAQELTAHVQANHRWSSTLRFLPSVSFCVQGSWSQWQRGLVGSSGKLWAGRSQPSKSGGNTSQSQDRSAKRWRPPRLWALTALSARCWYVSTPSSKFPARKIYMRKMHRNLRLHISLRGGDRKKYVFFFTLSKTFNRWGSKVLNFYCENIHSVICTANIQKCPETYNT